MSHIKKRACWLPAFSDSLLSRFSHLTALCGYGEYQRPQSCDLELEASLLCWDAVLATGRPPYLLWKERTPDVREVPVVCSDEVCSLDFPLSHGRIDFNDTDDEQLKHLSETCDKATFGLNKEDVLDESYRKAGKLDSSNICTKLDPERSGLINIIRYNLLQGNASTKPIKAELYKLNVYGATTLLRAFEHTRS